MVCLACLSIFFLFWMDLRARKMVLVVAEQRNEEDMLHRSDAQYCLVTTAKLLLKIIWMDSGQTLIDSGEVLKDSGKIKMCRPSPTRMLDS